MLHVCCDFAGTITEPDTLRFLTERLGAGPEHYRETGRLLCAGALSLREAVARDVGTIRAPFAEAAALLRAHVAVDTGFAPFARWCAAHAVPLNILSGGFEEIVELLLGPTGAPVHDVRANRFRPGTWECRFRDDSPHGHDKAAALRSARAEGRRRVARDMGLRCRAAGRRRRAPRAAPRSARAPRALEPARRVRPPRRGARGRAARAARALVRGGPGRPRHAVLRHGLRPGRDPRAPPAARRRVRARARRAARPARRGAGRHPRPRRARAGARLPAAPARA